MASVLQQYHQLADRMATQITGSYQSWTDFLTTAARLYKYPYHEQLMIYAQRPEATACADYELWNKRMGRYVRRGAKGIALIDHSGDTPKLKYVFDVADTRTTERSRSPYLWEFHPEHEQAVSDSLELQYDIRYPGSFSDLLEQISSVKVTEYFLAHQQDILDIVDGSYLEQYHDYDKGVAFLNAATASTTYMLLSRCGLAENAHFAPEDFMPVFDFNTPQTVDALGSAISGISEEILRNIEVTIKKYEREKLSERSQENERTDLHSQRGLLDSQPDSVPAGEHAPGQVRENAEEVSTGASPGAVEPPDPVGAAVSPSAGDRRDGEQAVGADDAHTDAVGRSDGSSESQRPHEMGGADEQPESPGRGSDPDGADLHLTEDSPVEQFSFFPTEAQQIESITEAERVQATPSAFSMFISQADIDHILRTGGNADDARMKIVTEFSKQKPVEDRAAFLKALYHGGNGLITENGKISAWYSEDGIYIASGDTARYLPSAQVISWADAAGRTEELLDSGTFATNLEVAEAPRNERQAELNTLYDSFTEKYGILNSRGNRLAFSDDSAYYLLCALEILDDDGNFQRKADMFSKRTIQPHKVVTSVDTAVDALTISIGERACVDLGYMSSLSGESINELTADLQGVIFHDPKRGALEDDAGWVTADEYLSGNVRQKLKEAEAAAAENPMYQSNVDALRAAQPKDLEASEIEVRLGATWIDKAYIQQFMYELLDTPYYLRRSIHVEYSPYTAAWNISNKRNISGNDVAAWNTYGTDYVSAYDILEDSLNLRDVRVYDTVEDEHGKPKRVLNGKQTTLAQQKQQLIRDAFKDWIWADPTRRQTLVEQYNREMNSIRPREYDGSHGAP